MHQRIQKPRQYPSLFGHTIACFIGLALRYLFGVQHPLSLTRAEGMLKECVRRDLQSCWPHEHAVHHVVRATISSRGKTVAAVLHSPCHRRDIAARSRSPLSFSSAYLRDHSALSTPSVVTPNFLRGHGEEHKGSLYSLVGAVGSQQSFLQRRFGDLTGADAQTGAHLDAGGQKGVIHEGDNSCPFEKIARAKLNGENPSSLCRHAKRCSANAETLLSNESQELFTTNRRGRQMIKPLGGNGGLQNSSERCTHCSCLTSSAGLGLFQSSSDAKGMGKGQRNAQDSSGTRVARRGGIARDNASDGGVLIEQSVSRLTKVKPTGFSGLRKRASEVLTRIFSSRNMMKTAQLNETLDMYLESPDALKKELTCIRVYNKEKRRINWNRFCQRFQKMSPLFRICSLYKDFLDAKLLVNDQCKDQSIVECFLRLELPLMQPFLVNPTTLPTSGKSSSSQPSSLRRASSRGDSAPDGGVSVGWRREGTAFLLDALSSTRISLEHVPKNSSCEFTRIITQHYTGTVEKRKQIRNSEPQSRDAVKMAGLIKIYSAGMSANGDGMLLHLTSLMLDESRCAIASRRRRKRKVTLRVAARNVQVPQQALHENALSRLFVLALVPTHTDCTVQHGHTSGGAQQRISATHNCDTIIKSKRLEHILSKVATDFAAQEPVAVEALEERILRGIQRPGVPNLEEIIRRLKQDVTSTVLMIRRSKTVKTKILNKLGKWRWLRKLLGVLVTKMLGLGSRPVIEVPSLIHMPMPCLEASVSQMTAEVPAHLLCSTGQRGLESILKDVLKKQLEKGLARAKEAMTHQGIPSHSTDILGLLQRIYTEKSPHSTSSTQSTGFLKSKRIPAYSKNDCGTCSRRKHSRQSFAFKNRVPGAQVVLEYGNSTDEAAKKRPLLETRFEDNLNRSVVSSSFAEAAEDDDSEGRARRGSKTKTYIIAGAVLASLLLFTYAGPLVAVIVVVVGLVVGAVLSTIPGLRARLQERAAARPRETDEESQPFVESRATADED